MPTRQWLAVISIELIVVMVSITIGLLVNMKYRFTVPCLGLRCLAYMLGLMDSSSAVKTATVALTIALWNKEKVSRRFDSSDNLPVFV